MDWPSSMAMFGYARQPGEEEVDDEVANAVQAATNKVGSSKHDTTSQLTSKEQQKKHPPISPTLVANEEQRKAENEKKAADLRAKLIAQRRNTSVMKRLSAAKSPSKSTSAQLEKPNSKPETRATQPRLKDGSDDKFGLGLLLAEGRAAAESRTRQSGQIHHQSSTTVNGNNLESFPDTAELGQPLAMESSGAETRIVTTEHPLWASNSTDAYYSDLSLWLEVTGYHDVEYRRSKLATHRERKSLEQEAARIAERLQVLRQAEQSDLASLRPFSLQSTSASLRRPPPLPAVMPDSKVLQQTLTDKPPTRDSPAHDLKRSRSRSRSPASERPEKSVRHREDLAERRSRSVRATPYTNVTAFRRSPTPSPTGMGRSVSYPEMRRRSTDKYHGSEVRRNDSRDPSLERRQKFYNLESDVPHEKLQEGTEYSSIERPLPGTKDYDSRPQYRGSGDLELRKSGVRFFMIKSWNYQNVEIAMRDRLWASQQKNEQVLAEAYKTSRHVVLLFSVNKSMHFQGYALMSSPPDPSMPKPEFCAKLNWNTSPSFTLRWLAKTAVHFRHVGHLVNELNLDERNKPMAVLVGQDGQEISREAGLGVVEILEDAERLEGFKRSQVKSASRW